MMSDGHDLQPVAEWTPQELAEFDRIRDQFNQFLDNAAQTRDKIMHEVIASA